jgi:uncharacterized membrane protein (DUF4010 family)
VPGFVMRISKLLSAYVLSRERTISFAIEANKEQGPFARWAVPISTQLMIIASQVTTCIFYIPGICYQQF